MSLPEGPLWSHSLWDVSVCVYVREMDTQELVRGISTRVTPSKHLHHRPLSGLRLGSNTESGRREKVSFLEDFLEEENEGELG